MINKNYIIIIILIVFCQYVFLSQKRLERNNNYKNILLNNFIKKIKKKNLHNLKNKKFDITNFLNIYCSIKKFNIYRNYNTLINILNKFRNYSKLKKKITILIIEKYINLINFYEKSKKCENLEIILLIFFYKINSNFKKLYEILKRKDSLFVYHLYNNIYYNNKYNIPKEIILVFYMKFFNQRDNNYDNLKKDLKNYNKFIIKIKKKKFLKKYLNFYEKKYKDKNEDFVKNFTKSTDIKYKILKKIGEGSFGIVYKIKIEQKYYALKCLKKIYNKNLYNNLIVREVIMYLGLKNCDSFKLKYYNLLKIENNKICFIMDLINYNLDELISKKKMNIRDKNYFEQQLSENLKYIKDNKIIHQDIKPENVFIYDNNKILIWDYGLSILETKKDMNNILNDKMLQNFWKKLKIFLKVKNGSLNYFVSKNSENNGSPYYMSLDSLENNKYYIPNYKKDNWALGLVLYKIRNGLFPLKLVNNIKEHIKEIKKLKKKVKNSKSNLIWIKLLKKAI